MNFQKFINQGWNDHPSNPQDVADRCAEGVALVSTAEDLNALCSLAGHVFSEHLGQWEEGNRFFASLLTHRCAAAGSDTWRAIKRWQAVLHLAAGNGTQSEVLTMEAVDPQLPVASTQARVASTAAAALAARGSTPEAATLFQRAVSLAAYGPARNDPLARALAVTGNNLAADLEAKTSRTTQETELMILAAQTARQFWAVAGSWLEVERAEYRLAMSLLQAGKVEQALVHAEACLQICQNQQAGLFEQFFAHEARCKCLRALGREEEAHKALAQAKSAIADLEWSLGYMRDELAKLEL